jgi:hypothetical protein
MTEAELPIYNMGIKEGMNHSKPSIESLTHHKQVDKFMEEINKKMEANCIPKII